MILQLISLVTARKPLKTKRAVHVQIILIILAGLSIVLPSLSCVAVTQFRKDGLLPEWLNTMFVQIFVYSYVWAKHTVYLYPVRNLISVSAWNPYLFVFSNVFQEHFKALRGKSEVCEFPLPECGKMEQF